MTFVEVFRKYPCDLIVVHFDHLGIHFVYYGVDLNEFPIFDAEQIHPDAEVRVQKRNNFYHVYFKKGGLKK